MKKIDLHVHTTASDGTLSPREVVSLAKQQQLCAIAITDHDTIDGIKEALEAGREHQLEIIPGAELSCSYDSHKELHIVGLFLNPEDFFLKMCLQELKEIRDARNEEIALRFQQIGIPVSISQLQLEYPNAIITRAHFAAYLASKGYAKSVREVFDRYLHDHGPCYVPRKHLNPKDTIDTIHRAGGLAILAHPMRYGFGQDALSSCVQKLARLGLDGLEGLYSTYTGSDESYIRRLARENHLLLSGGSDFHGANKPQIQLGHGTGRNPIPYDILEQLRSYR